MTAHFGWASSLQAASIGNEASIPLGVAKADLHLAKTLHRGQQGSVLQGTFQTEGVAVKKARISTAQAWSTSYVPLCAYYQAAIQRMEVMIMVNRAGL